ncbi:MAG: succinyl-CoA--3-ketoacid-CoA transferase [Dehalococcoidia bacterium]|nr:succinyl-CoA--3-ketoacid-CoA transferase [Dehalococcoidia bacterium]
MKERLSEDVVALRAAKELKSGDCCNLGLGMPGLLATCVPEGVRFQTENGALGYGALVTEDNWQEADYGRVDAGARFFVEAPGMSYFDFLTSFAMIRSGRIYTVLGGLQVSEKGDLANHSVGGDEVSLMIGGAMDLAWGAKKVIVIMTHTTKDGKPKIVRELTLPTTARNSVDLVITDIAVMEITDKGIVLKETAPGWSVEEIQALTEPKLILAPDLKEMEL